MEDRNGPNPGTEHPNRRLPPPRDASREAINLSTQSGKHHTDTAAIVLCAGALTAHGTDADLAVNVVVKLTTTVLIGERNRMASRLRAGDENTFAELASTMRNLVAAVRASATFLEVVSE